MSKITNSQRVQEWRKRAKERLITIHGGQCCSCEYKKCSKALEFHHIDPLEKDFSISNIGITMAFEKMVTETRKCILLCANCHREVHDGLLDVKMLPLSFNEQIAAEMITLVIDAKTNGRFKKVKNNSDLPEWQGA